MKTFLFALVLGLSSLNAQAGQSAWKLLEEREPAAETVAAEEPEVEATAEQKLEQRVDEKLAVLEDQMYMQSRRLEKLFLRMCLLTFTGILLGIAVGYSIARREKSNAHKGSENAIHEAEKLAFETKLLHVNTLIETYKNRTA